MSEGQAGKVNLYQMYDKNAGIVVGPIIAVNRHGPAVRSFNSACADKDSAPGKYPEDHELRWIGVQELETGLITGIAPETITNGHAWLQAQEARNG